jgi:hypothetical protein
MARYDALRSAASGGSGRGVGYGISTYGVITPDATTKWASANKCDEKAEELKKLAESCRKKVECYEKVKVGQESLCFN